jgi:hypothetical protein
MSKKTLCVTFGDAETTDRHTARRAERNIVVLERTE